MKTKSLGKRRHPVLVVCFVALLLSSCSDMLGYFLGTETGVRGDGRIYQSVSGEQGAWNDIANTETYWIWTIAYGNGRFVAVDNSSQVFVSIDDGNTWSNEGALGFPATPHVTFGNNYFFVCTFSGSVCRSTDGTQGSWTEVTSIPGSPSIFDITYGNGLLVAVGLRNAAGRVYYSGDDGNTWAESSPAGSPIITGIAYGGGRFIAVCDGGGQTWWTNNIFLGTWNSSAAGTGRFFDIAYGNNRFIAVGDCTNPVAYSSYMVWSSDGGVTWNDSSPVGGEWLHGIAYGNNRFVTVGYRGQIWYSVDDGVSWNDASISFDIDLLSVAYGNTHFLAVGGANP
ncbi:MAG: exo-alpha-sialidase [Spirochaetales bacterium]|nr:exo-alpha-sialidase [Spirochaetales bacterium]